jgi:hypothetical protein
MEGGALTVACDFFRKEITDVDKGAQFHIEHFCYVLSGRNSAVECQLPKLDVTGSIPVARSNFFHVQIVPAVPVVQTVYATVG